MGAIVIPPRLREHMIRMFISDFLLSKTKKRVVHWSGKCTTNETQIRGTDLRKLEQKGLLTFELSSMSDFFGVKFWDVTATEASKEELSEEFARRCAEADEQNARLEAPPAIVDEIDEKRADMADRADARARQRAAKA